MSNDEWLSDEEIIERWERQDKERASRSGKKHAANADDEGGAGGEKGRKPKQADILIGIADNAALFHTPAPDDDAFADIAINGHRETHRVRGRIFRGWLRHKYFELTGSACNSEALQAAIDTIEAKARYKGPEQRVHIRIALAPTTPYISILVISLGRRSKQRHRAGRLSMIHPYASHARKARSHCRPRNVAAQLICSGLFAI